MTNPELLLFLNQAQCEPQNIFLRRLFEESVSLFKKYFVERSIFGESSTEIGPGLTFCEPKLWPGPSGPSLDSFKLELSATIRFFVGSLNVEQLLMKKLDKRNI